jgi:hypothetical protein
VFVAAQPAPVLYGKQELDGAATALMGYLPPVGLGRSGWMTLYGYQLQQKHGLPAHRTRIGLCLTRSRKFWRMENGCTVTKHTDEIGYSRRTEG